MTITAVLYLVGFKEIDSIPTSVVFAHIFRYANTRWSCHNHSAISTGFNVLSCDRDTWRWMKIVSVVAIFGRERNTKYLNINVRFWCSNSSNNTKRSGGIDFFPRCSTVVRLNLKRKECCENRWEWCWIIQRQNMNTLKTYYLWIWRTGSLTRPTQGIVVKCHTNCNF